jgi:hypothetical protein
MDLQLTPKKLNVLLRTLLGKAKANEKRRGERRRPEKKELNESFKA